MIPFIWDKSLAAYIGLHRNEYQVNTSKHYEDEGMTPRPALLIEIQPPSIAAVPTQRCGRQTRRFLWKSEILMLHGQAQKYENGSLSSRVTLLTERLVFQWSTFTYQVYWLCWLYFQKLQHAPKSTSFRYTKRFCANYFALLPGGVKMLLSAIEISCAKYHVWRICF